MSDQLLEFQKIIRSCSNRDKRPDRETRQLLLYLFASTRGGLTRLRIVMHLLERQHNTHQLAQRIGIDYKAVQHHMRVLEKNNIVSKAGRQYGALFCLSDFMEVNLVALDEAITKLDRKLSYKKVYL